MAPFKSSLAKTAKQLLSVRNTADLDLRGATQSAKTAPPVRADIRFALFGGGGSGGGWVGGGGGGGGYVEENDQLEPGVSYAITIGAGGATPSAGPSSPEANHHGNPGTNTTFATFSGTYTAYGGGGGGTRPTTYGGLTGGSGGGGGPSYGNGNRVLDTQNPAQASPPQPKVLSRVQGYPGGTGPSGDDGQPGGGGAGGVGGNNNPGGGAGGAGVTTTNFGPLNVTAGAGGGGCPNGQGGSSIGGDGGAGGNSGTAAAANTGSGGGGSREAGGPTGGAGSGGVFLIRVPTDYTVTNSPGATTNTSSGYHYVRRYTPGTISVSPA